MGDSSDSIDRMIATMRELQTGVADRVMGHFSSMLDLDFTLPQFMVLYFLSRHRDEAFTVSRLASIISLSQPATSQLIDRLLQRGLLMRRENPEDRRQKLISINEQGLALIDRVEARREQKMRHMFSKISEADLVRMQHALNDMIEIFKPLMATSDWVSASQPETSQTPVAASHERR